MDEIDAGLGTIEGTGTSLEELEGAANICVVPEVLGMFAMISTCFDRLSSHVRHRSASCTREGLGVAIGIPQKRIANLLND